MFYSLNPFINFHQIFGICLAQEDPKIMRIWATFANTCRCGNTFYNLEHINWWVLYSQNLCIFSKVSGLVCLKIFKFGSNNNLKIFAMATDLVLFILIMLWVPKPTQIWSFTKSYLTFKMMCNFQKPLVLSKYTCWLRFLTASAEFFIS